MEQLKQKLRKPILEQYGMDIDEAEVHYSTKNYVYVFPTDDILRISLAEQNIKQSEREAELTFLLDIYHHCKTVCVPKPSLTHHYIERIHVDGKSYPVVKSVKAKGTIIDGASLDAKHAESVGAVLGSIHLTSREAEQRGQTYDRPSYLARTHNLHQGIDSADFSPYLDVEARAKLHQVIDEVKAIKPCPGDNYGLLHGDFTHYNYYADGSYIWVFDFDDCHYGYYMYDIGTLFINWLLRADAGNNLSSQAFVSELLPAFRRGYEQHMVLFEDNWNQLTLFMQYRLCIMILDSIYSLVTQTGKIGGTANTGSVLPTLLNPLLASDLYEGIDRRKEDARIKREKMIRLLREGPDPENPEDMAMMKFIESDDMKPFIEALLKQS